MSYFASCCSARCLFCDFFVFVVQDLVALGESVETEVISRLRALRIQMSSVFTHFQVANAMLAAHTKRMIAAAAAGVIYLFFGLLYIALLKFASAGVDSHRAFRRHGFTANKQRLNAPCECLLEFFFFLKLERNCPPGAAARLLAA